MSLDTSKPADNTPPPEVDFLNTQRYEFHKSRTEGYYNLADLHLQAVAASWPQEMAMMLGMMYQNTATHHGWHVANEFMYGCLMGHTHTLIHADKLPKLIRRENPETKTVETFMRLPTGQEFKQPETSGPALREALDRMGMEGDPQGIQETPAPANSTKH